MPEHTNSLKQSDVVELHAHCITAANEGASKAHSVLI